MSLTAVLAECVSHTAPDKTIWVAYSGGLDSHALLHCLASVIPAKNSVIPAQAGIHPKLRAIHINHSLSPNAPQWVAHCQHVCATLNVDFTHHTIDAHAQPGQSPEEVAREKRYAIFQTLVATGDSLYTAHHQDDQAETLLLQLLRGAGPKGLSAMPRIKPLGNGYLVRPLLSVSREALAQYATDHQLQWIEDESNTNTDFSRNFIRHDILPVLKKRWPSVTTTLARVSEHCAEAQGLIETLAAADLAATQEAPLQALSIPALLQLDSARQRQVLRAWLQQRKLPLPSATKLHQLQQTVLSARGDKMPCVKWRSVEIRRFQNQLYALSALPPHDVNQVHLWDLQQPLELSVGGVLQATEVQGGGLRTHGQAVTVRYRQGGERCRLPHRGCAHTLKQLFQEWKVPTWLRDRIPLLYLGNELAAIGGYAITEEFVAGENEQGYLLQLREA